MPLSGGTALFRNKEQEQEEGFGGENEPLPMHALPGMKRRRTYACLDNGAASIFENKTETEKCSSVGEHRIEESVREPFRLCHLEA